MNDATVIVFPRISALLGGAESVTLTARLARVKMPGVPEPVKLPRKLCPPVDQITSFNLADTVNKFLQ